MRHAYGIASAGNKKPASLKMRVLPFQAWPKPVLKVLPLDDAVVGGGVAGQNQVQHDGQQ